MSNLLGDLDNLGISKSMQKKLGKVPDQQIQSMLEKYGGLSMLSNNEQQPMTARQKLRQRIKDAEGQRFGNNSKQNVQQNAQPTEQPPQRIKDLTSLTPEEKKTRDKNRMKRLKQKHGIVIEDNYYEALNQRQLLRNNGNITKVQSEKMQGLQNVIDLYNYQHRNDGEEKERELDLDLDSIGSN